MLMQILIPSTDPAHARRFTKAERLGAKEVSLIGTASSSCSLLHPIPAPTAENGKGAGSCTHAELLVLSITSHQRFIKTVLILVGIDLL